MEEKKNSPVVGIIILVVCVLICVVGWYIGTKSTSKLKSKPVELVEEDYDLDKAKELIDNYYFKSYSGDLFTETFTDSTKAYIALTKIEAAKKKSINCADYYEANDKGEYIVKNSTSWQGVCDSGTYAITYDDFNETYSYIFEKSLKKDSIDGDCLIILDYNKDTKEFISLSCKGGGVNNKSYFYEVKSAKTKGEELTIEVEHYYTNPFDPNDTESNKTYTYKFTFKYDKDHYVLKDLKKETESTKE